MIAYVITQPWTNETLLTDGTWGHYEEYWEMAWEFTSQVRANRRAATEQAVVCQILKPSLEADVEDSPKPPIPPLSSGQPSPSERRSSGLF